MHMKETEKEKSSYCIIPLGTTFNAVLLKIKIVSIFLVRMIEPYWKTMSNIQIKRWWIVLFSYCKKIQWPEQLIKRKLLIWSMAPEGLVHDNEGRNDNRSSWGRLKACSQWYTSWSFPNRRTCIQTYEPMGGGHFHSNHHRMKQELIEKMNWIIIWNTLEGVFIISCFIV